MEGYVTKGYYPELGKVDMFIKDYEVHIEAWKEIRHIYLLGMTK
jgi:hypothetical protein